MLMRYYQDMSENCSIMLLRYYWATVFDRELWHCITEISLRCQRTVALCYWDIIKLCQRHAALLLRYFKSPVAPHYWDIIEIHVCQRPVALCYWDIEISLILNCFCATCYAEVPYLCYKYIMGRDFVVYLILFIFHNTQIMRSGQLSNQFHLKEEYQTLLVTNGQRLHFFYIYHKKTLIIFKKYILLSLPSYQAVISIQNAYQYVLPW